MRDNIYDLLPEKISDEAAYHLVNFVMDLALELESYYFAQMKRHIDDNMPSEPPKALQDKLGVKPF